MPGPLNVKEVWPAPFWMTPLKVVEPPAGARVSVVTRAAAVGHRAPAADAIGQRGDGRLMPPTSKVAVLFTVTGLVAGRLPKPLAPPPAYMAAIWGCVSTLLKRLKSSSVADSVQPLCGP